MRKLYRQKEPNVKQKNDNSVFNWAAVSSIHETATGTTKVWVGEAGTGTTVNRLNPGDKSCTMISYRPFFIVGRLPWT